jgi:hypothetical protein
MMLTDIVRSEPPTASSRPGGPTVPVDEAILRVLADVADPVPLRFITQAVGDTTHHVHARIETLITKGLVVRRRAPGAPRRGPGASVYELP